MKKMYLLMQGEYDEVGVANVFEMKEIAELASRGLDSAWVETMYVGLSDIIIKRLSNKRKVFQVYVYTDEFTGDLITTCNKHHCFIEDKAYLRSHYETDLSVIIWATNYRVAERYAMMYFENVDPNEDERLRFRGKKIL